MDRISSRLELLALVMAIAIFAVIIDLVRRKKLREGLSLLWLIAGTIMFIAAIFPELMFYACRVTGFMTPLGMIIFFGMIFFMGLALQFSIHISRLQDDLKNITQKLALVEDRIETVSGGKPGGSPPA